MLSAECASSTSPRLPGDCANCPCVVSVGGWVGVLWLPQVPHGRRSQPRGTSRLSAPDGGNAGDTLPAVSPPRCTLGNAVHPDPGTTDARACARAVCCGVLHVPAACTAPRRSGPDPCTCPCPCTNVSVFSNQSNASPPVLPPCSIQPHAPCCVCVCVCERSRVTACGGAGTPS